MEDALQEISSSYRSVVESSSKFSLHKSTTFIYSYTHIFIVVKRLYVTRGVYTFSDQQWEQECRGFSQVCSTVDSTFSSLSSDSEDDSIHISKIVAKITAASGKESGSPHKPCDEAVFTQPGVAGKCSVVAVEPTCGKNSSESRSVASSRIPRLKHRPANITEKSKHTAQQESFANASGTKTNWLAIFNHSLTTS